MREWGSSLEIAISEADLSLLQILQHELLQMKDVEFAAYRRPHPLEKNYFLVVQTKEGIDPLEVLVEASEKAQKRIKSFIGALVTKTDK